MKNISAEDHRLVDISASDQTPTIYQYHADFPPFYTEDVLTVKAFQFSVPGRPIWRLWRVSKTVKIMWPHNVHAMWPHNVCICGVSRRCSYLGNLTLLSSAYQHTRTPSALSRSHSFSLSSLLISSWFLFTWLDVLIWPWAEQEMTAKAEHITNSTHRW